MSDLGAATWSETDASNTASPPNGWPEGMFPSDVNNAARADKGGEKRFWVRSNSVFTTAGSSTAYTLTYGQAAAAYYDGEEFSFVVDETCGAAPTLNINGLGARNLRKFVAGAYTNMVAGDLLANQPVRVRYNLADTTFDLVSSAASAASTGWTVIGTASPSAAATVDFTGISAAINNLMCVFELTPSADAAAISLRTYGADGVLDTGATDYRYALFVSNSGGGSGVTGSGAGNSSLALGSGTVIDNSAAGFGGDFTAMNIQAATNTKFTYQTTFLDSAGTLWISIYGSGCRAEADRITGVRLLVSSGTFTGKVTLYGSV